jgi:hypothetical protein
MAYFAVVKDRDNKAFNVSTCHLNLWVLPGFARRYFQFDVGVRIKAAEDGLTSFLLALPFIVLPSGVEDLHDLILRPDSAPLVFGEPVTVDGTKISYGDVTNLTVGRIHAQKSQAIKEWTSNKQHCSVWKIDLATTINKNEEQYLRFRFPIEQLGRRWLAKRSLLAHNGAIMDFRVADIREAQEAMDWASLQDKIVPITLLNAFVITPITLQARAVSPALKYTRLLEGNAWERYLGRKTGIIRSRQLLTFYWKAENISIEQPFRGFLDLSTEFGVSSLANHVRTGIVVMLAFLAALYAHDGYAGINPQQLKDLLVKFGYPAGGLTLVGTFGWMFRSWRPIKKTFSAIRWLAGATDRRLYRRTS